MTYDALSGKHDAITRRAYFLRSNQARISARKKPLFVDLAVADGMKSIPVLEAESVVTNGSRWTNDYAVTSPGGREFKLWRHNQAPETCELPVYVESSGTVTRVALTPFAVVGDTTMVGLVAAVIAFYELAESGYSFSP